MLMSNYLKFSSCEFFIFSTLEKVLDSFNSVLSAQLSVAEHGWAAPVSCHKSWWWPSGARAMEIGRSWWSLGPAHELSHFRTFQWIFLLLANIFLIIMWKSKFRIIPTTGDKNSKYPVYHSKFTLTCEAYRNGSQVLGLSVLIWHVTSVSQRWPPQIFPS